MSNENSVIEELNKPRGRDKVPEMVNYDENYSVPGSITPKEAMEREQKKSSMNEEIADSASRQEVTHSVRQPITFVDPELPREPLRKDHHSAAKPEMPVSVTEAYEPKPVPQPEAVTPVFPDVTESVAKQDEMKRTVVKAPEGFENPTEAATKAENFVLDHTHEEPLENEFVDEPVVEETPVREVIQIDEKTEEAPIVEPYPAIEHPEPTKGQYTNLEDVREEQVPTKEPETTSVEEDKFEGLKEASEIEVEEEKRAVSEEEQKVAADVPDNLPEGTYVKGMTGAEVLQKMINEENELNKRIPVVSSPKELNAAELTEIMDFTKTHYRIIQGITRDAALKAPVHVETGKVHIIKNSETPDFELRRLNIERLKSDGERRVQVVCTQSGYSVICKPMNSRELRTFGRDTRSQLTDSYNTNMAQAAAIYAKLSEFSCGPMSFEEWLSNTAFPDLQTCIFGVYMATYPFANNFNLSCAYCGEDFAVSINNDTMICIPVGSTTQEMIREVLFAGADPVALQKSSKRYTGIDIFLNNKTRFFRVRTPSIAEFYDRAYRGKKEEIINENQADMYYAGYVRGYGILDIDHYNKTGDAAYLYDESIETIDREIANLAPDDKRVFEQHMLNYINKYSVSYQIPRVQCPHCKKIMSQREVNMKTLFFEVKAQKGL